ncbi:low-specificity L-threonine aldolase [Leisingera sp. M523]|uniref:low-specificity L-threonine aldolase n=1 Tax=Leisingera sp. M523 TaxID=2867013 RepID=UPI0021A5EC81|nr:low-specificity L-threonine aldolase [Leisingera sp. M523]UWQ28100.1 low-specificity L-threonine aldolase [Leisingera sp. M523]
MSQYAGLAGAGANAALCDLRSDTLTRPDAGMMRAIQAAELGDDVYGEDPQVNRLEAVLAERLGKEAALFLPTGTMSNLAGLLAHCQRGEEIILGAGYHVYAYEAAGASVLGGISLCPVPVRDDGALDPEVIAGAVKADDSHLAVSRLLSLENTHNGLAVPLADMAAAATAGRTAGLAVHLDGARFFNATVALGCSEAALAGLMDTVSICLSKGLGTPAGSVLAGPADLIAKARRWRKMLGGGMRQAGVLAAAALYALEHNVERLAQDHDRAAELADVLRGLGAGEVSQATNMVFFTPKEGRNDALRMHLASEGVVIGGGSSGAIRMVLHKDVDNGALDRAVQGLKSFYG